MSQPHARSGVARPTFCLHATLVLAALAVAACGRPPVAKVTRSDGTALIGEVVGSRPDVVILRLRAGEDAAISRATIESIVVPTVDELARHSTSSDDPNGGGSSAVPSYAGGSNPDGSNSREADASSSRGATGSGAPTGANGAAHAGGAPTEVAPTGDASDGGPSGGSAPRGGAPGGRTPAGEAPRGASGGGAPSGGIVVHDAVIPENTALTVALDAVVASHRTVVNAPIEATLTAPVNVPEGIALPVGTRLRGAVTEAVPSSLARGRGRLTLHFHSLVIAGETIAIDTTALPFRAPGFTRDDAKKIGIGAAIGAGIGKVVSKTKRGLGIGGAAGAAGTAAVVSRKDVELGRGTVLRVMLNEPVALGAARHR